MPKTSTEHRKEENYIIRSDPTLPQVEAEISQKLQARLNNTRRTFGYQFAYFKETFSDELWQAMEHRGLNQSAFAQKAGVPKQFLTKVFRGGNCTMETIVKLAYALNYTAHIHLTPNDVGCKWMHWVPTTPRVNAGFVRLWSNQFSTVKKVDYDPVAADT